MLSNVVSPNVLPLLLAAGENVGEAVKNVTAGSFLTTVLSALLTIFGAGAVRYLLPKLPAMTQQVFDWLHSQSAGVKNAYARGILDRLIDLVAQKVLMLENTAIEDLKQKAADGVLTQEELIEALKGVKQRAIDEVKGHASAQGIWDIAKTIFLGDETALTKWLGDTVESAVAKLPPSNLQTTTVMAAAQGVKPAIVTGAQVAATKLINSFVPPTVPPTAAL